MDGGAGDTQAYMDQSILAIFQDTPVPSEVPRTCCVTSTLRVRALNSDLCLSDDDMCVCWCFAGQGWRGGGH